MGWIIGGILYILFVIGCWAMGDAIKQAMAAKPEGTDESRDDVAG